MKQYSIFNVSNVVLTEYNRSKLFCEHANRVVINKSVFYLGHVRKTTNYKCI